MTVARLLAVTAALLLVSSTSHAQSLEAANYRVLGVMAGMKRGDTLHFGRVIIQVDSSNPKTVLATASAVGHSLIDSGTLGAIQIFAYPNPPRSAYETADITYSSDPEFMNWKDWSYRMSGMEDEKWYTAGEGFEPSKVVIPSGFPDPSELVVAKCDDLRRCDEGQTDLQMPR